MTSSLAFHFVVFLTMPGTRSQCKGSLKPVLPKIKTHPLVTPDDNPLQAPQVSAYMEEHFTKLSEKIDELIVRLDARDKLISSLQDDNAALRSDIQRLEGRLEDVEAYQRRNDVIVSGDVVTNIQPGVDIRQGILQELRNTLRIDLSSDNIVSAHRIGNKPPVQHPDKRKVLIKLSNYSIKSDLLRSCRNYKPNCMYINDNLTPFKSNLLYSLRVAKKKFPNRIAGCGSYDGKVYVWIKPLNPSGRNQKLHVNSSSVFEKLCKDELDIDPVVLTTDRN